MQQTALMPGVGLLSYAESTKQMPGEFFEIVDVVAYAFFGWRYVFSPAFRARTHKRWEFESRLTILLEIIYGAFGIGVTLLLFWLLVSALRG